MLDLASGDEERIAAGFGSDWSPDGERIAFFSGRDRNGPCLFGECTGHASELYVVDSDGSDEQRLTETTAHEDFAGWTPDGEWILFSRIEDDQGDYDLYAVRVDGECEVQLTDTDEAWEWSASWVGRDRLARVLDLDRAGPRGAEEAAELRLDEAHVLVHRLERRLGGLARLLCPSREQALELGRIRAQLGVA